jgi:agmatinase
MRFSMLVFDPNSLATKDANIFGLPFTEEEAQIVFIPVPWEVTVSYNAGTAQGPQAIFAASHQVDLFESVLKDAWKIGQFLQEDKNDFKALSDRLRPQAQSYIASLEEGENAKTNENMRNILSEINEACAHMCQSVEAEATALLKAGKFPCLIGGDHSTPLGLIRALEARHPKLSILHIDAHADLRDAYEGFTYSHASIMFNVLKETHVEKLVQVGIRDCCQEEVELIENSRGRITTFFDREIKAGLYSGQSFADICRKIIAELGPEVYISFDIDGLDPRFCPNTGTPVPGGLEYDQALYLFEELVKAGKKIVGFDLNEVAPGADEWDANVGSRILYRMANLLACSNKLKPLAI